MDPYLSRRKKNLRPEDIRRMRRRCKTVKEAKENVLERRPGSISMKISLCDNCNMHQVWLHLDQSYPDDNEPMQDCILDWLSLTGPL